MKPKPPVKLPKGRVLYATTNCVTDLAVGAELHRWQSRLHCHPVAVLPCRNRQAAREIVRLHSAPQALLLADAVEVLTDFQKMRFPISGQALAVLRKLNLPRL